MLLSFLLDISNLLCYLLQSVLVIRVCRLKIYFRMSCEEANRGRGRIPDAFDIPCCLFPSGAAAVDADMVLVAGL